MDIQPIIEMIDFHFPNERKLNPDVTSTLEHFVRDFGSEKVLQAFDIARKKKLSRNDTMRYMFGICWNWVPKNKELKFTTNQS